MSGQHIVQKLPQKWTDVYLQSEHTCN